MMTYQEAVDYIEETPKFTKKNSLDHTRAFLKRLGSPEDSMKILHVAGTNGKGSVCSFLASILHAAGKSTGLFTSPHLVDINERFVIDEKQVSDEAFLMAFQKVMDCVNEMKEEGYPHPTYFELLFLIGMVIFREAGVEYLVLETGLGGRLDATNSIAHPLVTVLTSISLDHTEYLGHTVAAIAGEKAGIIKEGVPVVYDASCKEAEEVILARAKEMHAPVYGIRPDMYKILGATEKSIDFSIDCGYYEGISLSISSVAEYQMKNATEAVTAIRVMDREKGEFTDEMIRKGISGMRWQGRMETVLPGVIIMEALAQCASIAVLQSPELRGCIGFLTGIDAAKFRRQVAPGETVTLRATIVKSSRRLVVAEVEASVDGEVCATATQKYVLAPKE